MGNVEYFNIWDIFLDDAYLQICIDYFTSSVYVLFGW